MWAIEFTARAWGDLQRLERSVQKRILDRLRDTQTDPPRVFRKLKGRPQYRLRVGEYRVLAMLRFDEKTLTVIAIGHRSRIYDR